jgi:hypothetical protein
MSLGCFNGSRLSIKIYLTRNKYLTWTFFNKYKDGNILDRFKSTWINLSIYMPSYEIIITLWKKIKTNYETWFQINQILNDETEKKNN